MMREELDMSNAREPGSWAPLGEALRVLPHERVSARVGFRRRPPDRGGDGPATVAAGGWPARSARAEAVRRSVGPDALVVVPGIRPRWSVSDHAGQARTATPAEAVEAGATHVVIGRAVTRASDQEAALRRVRGEVTGALARSVD